MRVLVVEDNKRLADSTKKGLEQEGYAVDTAYDGEYGYDLASVEDYDTIVLDLMLPGMDGLEICKRLREENKKVPILMLTARGEAHDIVTGLDSGADDYLVKPFDFEELLARIRALNRRPRVVMSSKIISGKVVLDLNKLEVSVAGKQLALSRKELSLLEYLMRNKDKVLSKDQIIEHVWPFDSNVLPNTVEVYIGYLRNKFKKSKRGSERIIETVRGFGYRLVAD
jgi:DNA-binding response OmpR family regulator